MTQSAPTKRVQVRCAGKAIDLWKDSSESESSCAEVVRAAVRKLPGVVLADESPVDEVWNFTVRDEYRSSEFWPSLVTLTLFPFYSMHHEIWHLAKFRPGESRPFAAHGYDTNYTYVQQLLLFPLTIYQVFALEDDRSVRVLLTTPDYLKDAANRILERTQIGP